MISELYIENYRLDISSDLSSLLTFELDNVRNFAARGTTWSKTIVIPGTANNNKLFGHIFQIGQANLYNDQLPNVGYNFNASKSADCYLFQDQIQTFRGIIRLLQINIDRGKIEYEIAMFGKLAGLNVSLSAAFLHDLDFSAYDHTYNATNVVASWSNTPGTGYYYPHIDYGTYSSGKHDWDIRTFRPALYAREYIDKMMTVAGFRWSSDLFNTDRFKRIIIPHNRKTLVGLGSSLGSANIEDNGVVDVGGTEFNFTSFSGTDFSLAFANIIQYDNTNTKSVNVIVSLSGRYTSGNGMSIRLRLIRGVDDTIIDNVDLPAVPVYVPFNISFSLPYIFETNDQLYIQSVSNNPGDSFFEGDITGTISLENPSGTTTVNINPDDEVQINECIPKNIRQIDFLTSIVKLFNLYVYEDRFDTSLIYFKPYVDFYSTSPLDAVDWTYKLNRDKVIKVRPMSELTARKYDFKYRPDNDNYNELYRKRYNQGYGDHVFDSLYEFAEESKTVDVIFSATPLVGYGGEEKVYPTIFKISAGVEERIDSNIRIMLSKRITGVASWDIKDGTTVLSSVTEYGYAGHLDDPDAPSNDLNFGVLNELFFVLAAGDLTANQFNVYWSSYMAEITDKDSKLMSARFYLTPKDVFDLDFSKKVYVDGVLFRLNSIRDYNVTKPTDCPVELLKVNYLIY